VQLPWLVNEISFGLVLKRGLPCLFKEKGTVGILFRLGGRGRCGSQAFFISYVCSAKLMEGTTKCFNIEWRSKFH
jgi:hypothetical protein